MARTAMVVLCVSIVCAMCLLGAAVDVKAICQRRCLMGRGGILCNCNAMHFGGKRSSNVPFKPDTIKLQNKDRLWPYQRRGLPLDNIDSNHFTTPDSDPLRRLQISPSGSYSPTSFPPDSRWEADRWNEVLSSIKSTFSDLTSGKERGPFNSVTNLKKHPSDFEPAYPLLEWNDLFEDNDQGSNGLIQLPKRLQQIGIKPFGRLVPKNKDSIAVSLTNKFPDDDVGMGRDEARSRSENRRLLGLQLQGVLKQTLAGREKKLLDLRICHIFYSHTYMTQKVYWALSDRVLLVKIAGKPVDLKIIQVYAPTANSNDEDLDKFYNDLDTAKTNCKSQDPLIIMGDFNAKVGTDKVDDIVGKHGLGIRNERGEELIEWCQTNDIIVGNTWFQQPPRRKWTWKSPGDETRNQIDYMMIFKRYRNALLLAKTYPSADCYSDHIPVEGKFKIKLKKNSKPSANIKFDLAILKTNQTIREKYQISVQNKFEALGDAEEVEHQWENFKSAIMEAATEVIPKVKRKAKQKWMTEEILNLMEERICAKGSKEKYEQIHKKCKKNAICQKRTGSLRNVKR
ncbi:craniofacial development protein 2-like [Plakobranchus ocellatus]|uniref:Craniofacial development protein 2-like n=1 Tax=Plakobranchus ocellatus TaxID=259542 RepID=A0AAV4CC96_9GAST|nr:craniofacial development protein 2-like [Plakobranchus ocellatus]